MAYLNIGDNIKHLPTGEIVGTCPDCGKRLVIKKGKFGKFVGCSGYRNGCRKTYGIENFKIFDQHICDLINLEKAQLNCDLKMAEKIRDTNKVLNFRACGICENIVESLWR